jgi:hypothetical protein
MKTEMTTGPTRSYTTMPASLVVYAQGWPRGHFRMVEEQQ